jgi:hypothetical protein
MYPSTFTELLGLIGVLVPVVIATLTGLQSSRTKVSENNLIQWRRTNELAMTLYNKDGQFGLSAQLVAAYELGEMAPSQRAAARAVLSHAREHYAGTPELSEALSEALARAKRRW